MTYKARAFRSGQSSEIFFPSWTDSKLEDRGWSRSAERPV